MSYGMYSKKGRRNSRGRIISVNYRKYTYQGLNFYIKQKFVSYGHDGDIVPELITKETYLKNKEKYENIDEGIEEYTVDSIDEFPLYIRGEVREIIEKLELE